jgi:hypothetical protein
MSWVGGLGAMMGLGAWGSVYGMVFLLGVAGACVVGFPWLGALGARYPFMWRGCAAPMLFMPHSDGRCAQRCCSFFYGSGHLLLLSGVTAAQLMLMHCSTSNMIEAGGQCSLLWTGTNKVALAGTGRWYDGGSFAC